MVSVISDQDIDVSELLPSEKVIDAKVVSNQGRHAGRIAGLYISNRSIRGFRVVYDERSYFIDEEDIADYDGEAIMLSMQPFYVLEGLKVYDDAGRYLGVVDDVIRESHTNEFKELVVKKHFFSSPISVAADHVKIANENVILNEDYADK